MAESLFPVFDMPDILEEEEDEEKYQPSVYFDFELGDFVLDGAHRMVKADGREAYIQWCLKMVETERDSYLAYSQEIGTEFEEIRNDDQESFKAEVEQTITDALMVHPATEYVRDFEFEFVGDEFYVSFVIKGYPWEEEALTAVIREVV